MATRKKWFVLEGVTVARDGKRITPPIGKTFTFTEQEVDDILRVRPEALREPTNEDPSVSKDELDALNVGDDGDSTETSLGAQNDGKTTTQSSKAKTAAGKVAEGGSKDEDL